MKQFFGDAEYEFKLTRPMVLELERSTGTGIGALCRKVFAGTFHLAEVTETIRLALIGAGLDPEKAKALSDTYGTTPSLVHGLSLAVAVLEDFYAGTPNQPDQVIAADNDPALKAAATGDLGAALSKEPRND